MKKSKMLAVTAAVTTAHLGLSLATFHEVFCRNATLPRLINEKDKKARGDGSDDSRVVWMHEQAFEEYIITSDNGYKLRGFYLPCQEKSNRFVLCSHGYRSRGKGEFRFISKFYHEHGYNIFLVDHRASGDSEENTITFGYHEAEDLLKWTRFLVETFGKDIEIALHGISMGAATVLLLCGKDGIPGNVRFAVSDCSYASVVGQFTDVLKSAHVPHEILIRSVDLINRIYSGFSFYKVRPVDAVKNAKLPILFIHGTKDGFVPVKNAFELYAACSSEKDILLVTDAGHSASYRKNSESYERKIMEFTEKYMD